jgi:hypothetical protein
MVRARWPSSPSPRAEYTEAALAFSSMWATRMEAKVGSVFASPILVSIGCGRSNDLAS